MYSKTLDDFDFAVSDGAFNFRAVKTIEDRAKVGEFLRGYFAEDEGVSVPSSATAQQLAPPYLDQGASVLAEDANGKLAAVCCACVIQPDDPMDAYRLDDLKKALPEGVALFNHATLSTHINVLRAVQKAGPVLVVDVVRVHPQFRRKGVAKAILGHALQRGKGKGGCVNAVTHATNADFEKLLAGWDKKCETKWADLKHDGKRYFEPGQMKAESVAAFAIKL